MKKVIAAVIALIATLLIALASVTLSWAGEPGTRAARRDMGNARGFWRHMGVAVQKIPPDGAFGMKIALI